MSKRGRRGREGRMPKGPKGPKAYISSESMMQPDRGPKGRRPSGSEGPRAEGVDLVGGRRSRRGAQAVLRCAALRCAVVDVLSLLRAVCWRHRPHASCQKEFLFNVHKNKHKIDDHNPPIMRRWQARSYKMSISRTSNSKMSTW